MSATASSAPDGSDLFSKESQSGTVIIVTAVLTGLSTVVVLLRLYTRQFILKTAGADDWTMGLAQLLSIAAGTSTILGAGALSFSWFINRSNEAPRGTLWTRSPYRNAKPGRCRQVSRSKGSKYLRLPIYTSPLANALYVVSFRCYIQL